MGHFCWMCERVRPNEAFSGRGHRQHLCKECSRLPKAARERKDRLDRLSGMLFRQRVISAKNVRMAIEWAESEDPEVRELAGIVADVGRAHPGRKRRLPFLKHRHPGLWARVVAAGLVFDEYAEDPWAEGAFQAEYPFEAEDVLEEEGAFGEGAACSSMAVGMDTAVGEAEAEGFEDEEIPF